MEEVNLILRNVLYVPNYKVNLLPVNKAVNFDHRFIFNKYQNVVNPSKRDINSWHKQFGHLNKTDVKRAVGCEGDTKDTSETCAIGKQASQPVSKEDENKAK